MISSKEIQDGLNVPDKLDSGIFAQYKEMLKKIGDAEQFLPSVIISPTGNIVWEEPEQEYLDRMSKLYYEVK